MDKLEIYPMHPTELSLMLHSHGLNIKYISQVYAKINSIFIRRILITEAASRSIKMINSQKMQEEITADPKKEDETSTVRSLLNLILGNSP